MCFPPLHPPLGVHEGWVACESPPYLPNFSCPSSKTEKDPVLTGKKGVCLNCLRSTELAEHNNKKKALLMLLKVQPTMSEAMFVAV